MKIADVVRSWRLLEKMSLRDTAELIGIDRSALYRMESGRPVSASNLAAVVRWLLSE
jgi:transcriptional regulator with XRE-family HTH domain